MNLRKIYIKNGKKTVRVNVFYHIFAFHECFSDLIHVMLFKTFIYFDVQRIKH